MIYTNNYERDQQAARIVIKVKKELPKVSIESLDGEQIFLHADKHFKFVDPHTKWVANLDDVPSIINQLKK
jgi:hypothetical protein